MIAAYVVFAVLAMLGQLAFVLYILPRRFGQRTPVCVSGQVFFAALFAQRVSILWTILVLSPPIGIREVLFMALVAIAVWVFAFGVVARFRRSARLWRREIEHTA